MNKRTYIKHNKDPNHPNFPHGQFSGYRAGCKCKPCNSANNEKKKLNYQDNHPKLIKRTKVCKNCNEEKLLDEYYLHNADKWPEPNCKKCSKSIRRAYRLLKDYNLTQDQFNKLIKDQNNCCAACKYPFTDVYFPCIDHCHTSGKVRGLLHSRCNQAIGIFRDSPEIFRNVANYLEQGSTIIP